MKRCKLLLFCYELQYENDKMQYMKHRGHCKIDYVVFYTMYQTKNIRGIRVKIVLIVHSASLCLRCVHKLEIRMSRKAWQKAAQK